MVVQRCGQGLHIRKVSNMGNNYSITVIRERIRKVKERRYKDTIDNDKPSIIIVVTKEHQKRSKQYSRVSMNARNGLKKLQQLGL